MYQLDYQFNKTMEKITVDDIILWLGTSNPKEEAINTLFDIANGEYSIENFKKDIISLKD